MHGEVGASVEEGFLDFLDEETLAPDLGQGHVKNLVAAGFDDAELYFKARFQGHKAVTDMPGLPEGKLASAGGDDEFGHAVRPPSERSRRRRRSCRRSIRSIRCCRWRS